MSEINVFITGATGYIGGAVLQHFLYYSEKRSEKYKFTALVRSSEKAAKLNAIGIETVVGSHSDLDKIEEAASKSDLVIAAADADHVEAAKATLRGLKRRYENTGKQPVFIHTSGTGLLMDDAAGMYAYDTIYDDSDVAQISGIPPTALHRNVEQLVIDADKEGYARTYIVLPSTIYGLAKGKLFDLGISNPHSIQLPLLIKASLDRGQGGMVGKGANRWPNVHIEDVSQLYVDLYDAILKGTAGHGQDGYYFGENGEHTLFEVGKRIAEVLVELGKGKDTEPTTFSDEEVKKYFGAPWLGSNSRAKATHSRSIGWKPKYTKEDMLASLKPETEAILKKEN